jgi:hypothetical protein
VGGKGSTRIGNGVAGLVVGSDTAACGAVILAAKIESGGEQAEAIGEPRGEEGTRAVFRDFVGHGKLHLPAIQ